MGRRPKGMPKDEPLGAPKRLTEKQFDLLAYILVKSFGVAEKHEIMRKGRPVLWSPKAFLERPATRSEAATLSARLTALEGHGLISKSGRYVRVTSEGNKLIRTYLDEHKQSDKSFKLLKLTLDLEESAERYFAVNLTIDTANKFERGHLLVDKKGVLPDLLDDLELSYRGIVERIEKLYPGVFENSTK